MRKPEGFEKTFRKKICDIQGSKPKNSPLAVPVLFSKSFWFVVQNQEYNIPIMDREATF